jgi:hypothetical protein
MVAANVNGSCLLQQIDTVMVPFFLWQMLFKKKAEFFMMNMPYDGSSQPILDCLSWH